MTTYAWVKRYKITSLQPELQDGMDRTKIVIKTENSDWVDTHSPVIVPFSVHSAFHEGNKGKLKVHAFLKTLKENVKNKITILFTEQAHIHALSINKELDIEKTIAMCTQDAHQLAGSLKEYMAGCDIAFWDNFINNDPDYSLYKKIIDDCYQTDKQFQQLLYTDAENSYSESFARLYPDKNLFIEKTVLGRVNEI